MTADSQSEPGGGKTAIGCLGLFCAMLGYILTIGFADTFYASTGRAPLDPSGGLGMLLAMGPPIWIAFAIAVVLAVTKKRFLWIAGSGVIVALASLVLAWLFLRGYMHR